MDRHVIDYLASLRSALSKGEFEHLGSIAEGLEKSLDQLGSISRPEAEKAAVLAREIAELLSFARRGIKRAKQRVVELRTAASSMNVYDREGAVRQLDPTVGSVKRF